MCEYYSYVLPGTNIHLLTFSYIAFEAIFLIIQVIQLLSRPDDKERLWFLILLFLLILYNIAGGLYPDPRLSTSTYVQMMLAYGAGILVSMYLPFFIYKFLNLDSLRFFAYYGSTWFLLIPFLVLFLVPYALTGDIQLSSKLLLVIPFFYAVSFLYTFTKNVFITNKVKWDNNDSNFKEKALSVYIAVTLWIIGLLTATFFHAQQIVEHTLTNAGFILVTVIFIRSYIVESRKEHMRLLKAEQDKNELLTQKIEERTKELEYAIEQKINTIVNLAHEIRTPLTLVNNYLDSSIEKHGKNGEFSLVKENIEVLNEHVNNFFNQEKFSKGLSVYNHNQIINFSKLVTDKIALFRLYAAGKNIELKERVQEHLHIKADPGALHSIINNLLENAIKFTSENGLIEVKLETDNDKIIFIVKDTGCGIPEDVQAKVFEPYFQINNKAMGKGIGIGLSILDNAVKSLSGSIALKSEVNVGSEFIVVLPVYTMEEGDKATDIDVHIPTDKILNDKNIEDAVDDIQRASILIIEDNLNMLIYLRGELKKKYNVYLATNGKRALLKLKTIPCPALIVSDIMMEETDGFDFIRIIKEDSKFNHIPVIFLTAKATNNDRLFGLELGAVDYISKPFLIGELVRKIEANIEIREKQKEALMNSMKEFLNEKLGGVSKGSKEDQINYNFKIYGISDREKEIIILISEGFSYKEIGEKLFLSEATVVKHKQNIFKKLQVNSKIDMVNKIFGYYPLLIRFVTISNTNTMLIMMNRGAGGSTCRLFHTPVLFVLYHLITTCAAIFCRVVVVFV